MYFVWGLGLKNNILQNVIESVFHQLTKEGEGKNSQVKLIDPNQAMG